VAAAALVLAVLAISWGSILVRLCDAQPLTIAFLRVGIASLLLAPPALAMRSRRVRTDRRWGAAAAAAGLLLALHFATWIASLSFTSIAASTLLVSTQPVFSLLLSRRLLGEKAGGRAVIAMLVALGGVALIVWGDRRAGEDRLLGDLLALAGAVTAAGYLIVGRRVRESVALPTYLGVVNLWAAIGAGGLALLFTQPLLPVAQVDLAWCFLMALVPHLLGHGTLNWAVRRLRAYLVNLTVLGEPVLASLYAFLVFAEAPPLLVYPGALLIGAGVALAFSETSARGKPRDGL
jgi:drug/metabolite transporter (DMT)-like permease